MIDVIRQLVVAAAPDPELAAPVRTCDPDEVLDRLIPFSSVNVLGVVVALEHEFGIRVRREDLETACLGGATLSKLATLVRTLRSS